MKNNIKKLYESWKVKKQDATVETVILSVGEIIRNYEQGRINITPEYQRTYKWNNEKKSRFIESLILGMPVPAIFAIKEEDEDYNLKYEIIDGLQRISTILEFVGKLKDNKNSEKLKRIEGTDILFELNGLSWDDIEKTNMGFIFESSTLLFMNLKTLKSHIKYETFKRLNTGGIPLESQEIRSNILSLRGDKKYKELIEKYEKIELNFLTEKDIKSRKDMELFLEFSLISEYKKFIKIFNEKQENTNNRKTFELLLDDYTEYVDIKKLIDILENYKEFLKLCEKFKFKKYDKEKQKNIGIFINQYFEIASFIYFKNKDYLIEENFKKMFDKTYEQFYRSRGLNNPPALRRLEEAHKYVEEILNE